MTSEQNAIQDKSNEKAYFTITPRLVWALCRDTYEYTLWGVVRDVAGDAGECILSTEDLATLAMQSSGKASQCRRYLMDIGLMEGELRRDPGYPQSVWHLSIPDRWVLNTEVARKLISLKDRVQFKRAQRDGALDDLTIENVGERLAAFLEESLHQVKPSPHEGSEPSPGEGGVSPGEGKKILKEDPSDDDGPQAASNATLLDDLPDAGLDPEQAEAYWCLRYVGVDDDVARAEAAVRDVDAAQRWACRLSQRGGGAGLLLDKLRSGVDPPDCVTAMELQRFLQRVLAYRAEKLEAFWRSSLTESKQSALTGASSSTWPRRYKTSTGDRTIHSARPRPGSGPKSR